MAAPIKVTLAPPPRTPTRGQPRIRMWRVRVEYSAPNGYAEISTMYIEGTAGDAADAGRRWLSTLSMDSAARALLRGLRP